MYLKRSLDQYKRTNIRKIAIYAYLVYLLLSLIDARLAGGEWFTFFIYRFGFGLPLFFSVIIERLNPKISVNLLAIFSIVSVHIGVALISRNLGGISSDYYFGFIVVSFLQFIFFPFVLWQTIAIDLIMSVFYFTLNTYQLSFDILLLEKQASNMLSFLLLKFVAIKQFNHLFVNNFLLIEEQKKFESQKNMQKLMGELCHLLNNPLFIALNFTKKILASSDPEEMKRLAQKSFTAIDRMKNVTSQMQKIQEGSATEIKSN